MTRKTRRNKPGGKAAEGSTGNVHETVPETQPEESEATSPARAQPKKKAAAEAETAKKVTLPAFGFAEDLLPKTDAGPDDGATTSVQEVVAQEVVAQDPRRIFAFADSLETGTTEPEVAPVRLETWVAFSLAGEVFALPVSPIREVVRVASITRVPHAPKPIRGVTNRRGRVIPVIDLRLRIDLPPTDLERSSRVIVVSSRGRLLGLLVDAVHQVLHIDLDQVQPPPDDVMTIQSDYLSGVYHLEDQLILLLDIDRALIIQDPTPETVAGTATQPDQGADAQASST